MSGDKRFAKALMPLIQRVRTDVTARKNDTGRQAWTRDALTMDMVLRHLNGGPARGVSQIKAGESVTMVGVLDFDSHKGEFPWHKMVAVVWDVMQSITLMGGAPIAFRSSGGRGVHVYCLWETPQDAYSVREWLRAALKLCKLADGSGHGGVVNGFVEVFPKQNEVPADGFGNQVILPLSGESVPLAWDDLVGDLVAGTREDAATMQWLLSDPVPLRERPVHAARTDVVVGLEELQSILDAIPNSGKDELAYDEWFKVLAGTHHVTEGSEDGLLLLHKLSSRASVYNPEKTDRDWGSARSDRDVVIGIGTLKRIAGRYGWHEPLSADEFADVSGEDPRPPTEPVTWDESLPGADVSGDASADPLGADTPVPMPPVPPAPPTPPRMLAKLKHRGIPEAQHLTTDQANARRLTSAFGNAIIVAAGKWRVWDGRHWKEDEADVYRYACRLSAIIKDEAKEREAKGVKLLDADPADADGKREIAVAAALMKWALKSEMKGTIEAAIGLARKMMTRGVGDLDRDPFALNCLNGTVDLRTGVIRKHDPQDYITRLVPLKYAPDAACPTWDRVLHEITRETDDAGRAAGGAGAGGRAPIADFLRRWFGYCLSADVSEQCFVVHWGSGANGKSTVMQMMQATSGDYAGTAAPGLLAASKGSDRHPTEIAALFGRRMVTAHESSEGVVLREDFVKQATGGDRITARFMREDFFEFDPTHKIQLLTNHKPQVKGQDEGIWRRVLLVPYLASFGSAEEVAVGKRKALGDMDLVVKLAAELEGILAWRVRGCIEWCNEGRLRPPAAVRAASEAYRVEQDRVGQFVTECCEVGYGLTEPLTEGMGGLYPAYQGWCKDGGIMALSKLRFMDEVFRVVAGATFVDAKLQVVGGGRRKVKMVHGLRLMQE